MPHRRHLTITCPNCGTEGRVTLEPAEDTPLLTIVHCDAAEGGCDTPYAVEVRLHVTIEIHTCRLALPSATRPDALTDLTTLEEPEKEISY